MLDFGEIQLNGEGYLKKNMKRNDRFQTETNNLGNYYEIPSAADSIEEKLIVAALRRSSGKNGIPYRSLMREAGIRDDGEFAQYIEKLSDAGEILIDKDNWVRLAPHSGEVEASIVSLSERFAFAKPKVGKDDIFIPGSGLNGAFLGDKVLLTELRNSERGPSGRVKKILVKSAEIVTGTMKVNEEGMYVTPDNAIRYDLTVLKGNENTAHNGDKVLIEVFPDYRGEWRYAKVKKVFGPSRSARICADAVLARSGISIEFPRDVLTEAEEISKMTIKQEDYECRIDLRDEAVLTIDGADSKDLDDAISVVRTSEGYSLGVHIADVTHYVKSGSAIDREAYKRGTSVYFPDRVVPMLPEALSNGVCSLNAGEDKLTFSALIDFDCDGNMEDFIFRKSVIRSKVRGVYSEVNSLFSGTASENIKKKYAPVSETLEAARELAGILIRRGQERGELDLSSEETKFVLDNDGVCTELIPREEGEAEKLIEALMVSANIAAAKVSLIEKVPFLYRVHEKPSASKVEELYELLDRLAVPCGELKKGKPSAKDFSIVLQRVRGQRLESLVNQRILRTMEKARYDDKELGHFGLALGEYSHFTSPIRRYPDLAIHRVLGEIVSGEDKEKITARYKEFVSRASKQSSETEIRAVDAERSADDCFVAEYMLAHLGEHHLGTISGVTPKGVFVRLDNNAEGFVSLNDFENRNFEFDGEVAHVDPHSGRVLMMGEELGVIIAGADVASGRVDFVPEKP